jgi:hypothetical protein
MSDIKTLVVSKTFKTILWGIGGLIIILGTFAAGIRVGLHKARYSYQWGANYERNFMGQGQHGMMGARGPIGPGGFNGGPGGMMRDFEGRDFRNAHGIAGAIVSITDNSIVIKDRDNKENTVNVSDKTIIKSGKSDIRISDLKADERIVVMGTPDDKGVVNADLIRIFDFNAKTNLQNQ